MFYVEKFYLFNIKSGLWFLVLFLSAACVTHSSPNPSPSGIYRYEEDTTLKDSPTEETILPPPPLFDVRIIQSWQHIVIICLRTTTLYTLPFVKDVNHITTPKSHAMFLLFSLFCAQSHLSPKNLSD